MKYQDCIDACTQCIRDCTICFNEMAGKESHNDCPKCCIECVEICELTVKALIRNSNRAQHYMDLCAEICEWCARQCRKHPDEHCQACAESCRKCAALCKREAYA